MIQALQGAPRYLYDQLPTLAECRKNVNSCKTTLVDFAKTHYGQAYTEQNRKMVCFNAFVSFGASVIVGSTVPVAVSTAALAVVASAVYVVAIPLFKALFADQHGRMSLIARTFCILTSVALTPGLACNLPACTLILFYAAAIDTLLGLKANVHTVPYIVAF